MIPFVVYRLALIIYNKKIAILSFIFFLISPVYWLCSSRIWLASTLTLFTTLSLLFFVTELKHKKYIFLCGLSLGLALLTKYPAILLLPTYIVFALIYMPDLLKKSHLPFITLIAFVVFLPWLLWNMEVYGTFNLGSKPDNSTRIAPELLSLSIKPVYLIPLAIAMFLLWFTAAKGYIAKIEQKIKKNKIFLYLLILLFISGIFLLKDIRTGLFDSLSLYKLPPVSNVYPSIFRQEAWSFYLAQLLKMSPVFILSYAGIFTLRSESKGDKLLLIWSIITLVFYIQWGNYQSRYILSAIPALTILAARVFFWLWDAVRKLPSKTLRTCSRAGLVSFLSYSLIKTIIVDYRLTMALFGQGYFTYF